MSGRGKRGNPFLCKVLREEKKEIGATHRYPKKAIGPCQEKLVGNKVGRSALRKEESGKANLQGTFVRKHRGKAVPHSHLQKSRRRKQKAVKLSDYLSREFKWTGGSNMLKKR